MESFLKENNVGVGGSIKFELERMKGKIERIWRGKDLGYRLWNLTFWVLTLYTWIWTNNLTFVSHLIVPISKEFNKIKRGQFNIEHQEQ